MHVAFFSSASILLSSGNQLKDYIWGVLNQQADKVESVCHHIKML
jgi:hypothetical protein